MSIPAEIRTPRGGSDQLWEEVPPSPNTQNIEPESYPSSTEVARLAGVSQSAVSRTFTPGASVSAKTREKVMAAARLLRPLVKGASG